MDESSIVGNCNQMEIAPAPAKKLAGMRLAFICVSLEPGRDGVGDYTRSLAAECIRQGRP